MAPLFRWRGRLEGEGGGDNEEPETLTPKGLPKLYHPGQQHTTKGDKAFSSCSRICLTWLESIWGDTSVCKRIHLKLMAEVTVHRAIQYYSQLIDALHDYVDSESGWTVCTLPCVIWARGMFRHKQLTPALEFQEFRSRWGPAVRQQSRVSCDWMPRWAGKAAQKLN